MHHDRLGRHALQGLRSCGSVIVPQPKCEVHPVASLSLQMKRPFGDTGIIR